MDLSSAWLSEIEMEVTGFNMDYDQTTKLYDNTIDYFKVNSVSSECCTENMTLIDKSVFQPHQLEIKPTKYVQENPNVINKRSPAQEPLIANNLPLSNTFTISFGDINPKDQVFELYDPHGYEAGGSTKNPIQLHDHVLQERKRREKLNQHFISLSALLPNHKKTGKASMLEEACNYIKELQGRVKDLEQLSDTERNIKESVISIKGSTLLTSNHEYSSSADERNSGESGHPLSPEIEVRMSGSSVLVRIYCQKNFSSFVKAITQMQKLGLSIISSSAMPFATTTLVINIAAEIEDDFCMTATDLVKKLQLAILDETQQ